MKVFLLCAVVLLSVSAKFILATNYCASTLCSAGKPHIACNNKGALASTCAANAKIMPITAAMQTAILKKHNTLRNKIAAGNEAGYNAAVRMATLVWDSELAKLAEYNVKQCKMAHDKCRNTDKYKYAGQNLAFSGWSGAARTVQSVIETHIQNWYNEQKDANMAVINKYPQSFPKKIGHFTQVAQDKAIAVGCAVLRETKNKMTYHYTACDYSRTNILNKPVYVAGTAASKCTTGKNPSYPALCSVNEKIDSNSL